MRDSDGSRFPVSSSEGRRSGQDLRPDRPLQIHFIDSWHPDPVEGSGTTVGVRSLVAGLRKLGHEVRVVRPGGGGTTLAERIAFNMDLPRRLEGRPLPDLIVGIDLDGFFWARSRHGRSPFVVCLKGIAADEARFERGLPRVGLESAARFERLNVSRADRVIVPSHYSAEVAARVYAVPEERIGVVPEPVDLSRRSTVTPVRFADRSTPGVTILSVARQYPRKDTTTLLRATAILVRETPNTRLRIVGDGPTLPDSRALAVELGLGDAVAFVGAVPDDRQVAREYSEADIFCLPSLQEGFGIAFVEAMAAGLPVVAARAGAAPEVVKDGESGILVPPGDAAGLAGALTRLARDPELRARMGASGFGRARRYGLEPVARAFLAEARLSSARDFQTSRGGLRSEA